MNNQIKTTALRYRPPREEDVPKMKDFLRCIKSLGCDVISSKDECGLFTDVIAAQSSDKEYSEADLVIVFGGDGTIIKAAREFSPYGTPVLGVNTGTLGYLAELSSDECDIIKKIIAGDFRIEERMMLDVHIESGDKVITPSLPAINEVVISNGPISRLIKYDLFCDGIQIQSARADGVIIATPTGSTAYSMSAGGPVADPSLDCIITTPICPFALNQRPVIYGANTVLEISSVACRENEVFLTLDGSDVFSISPEDRIVIKRSETRAKLVRIKHRSFLEVLHEKMS